MIFNCAWRRFLLNNVPVTHTAVPYFLYSAGILFREGLKALLVVVALVAGTREAGHHNRAKDIYAGALIAIVASIALAWGVNHLLTMTPRYAPRRNLPGARRRDAFLRQLMVYVEIASADVEELHQLLSKGRQR